MAEEKSGRVEHWKRGKVSDGQVIVAVGGENGSVGSGGEQDKSVSNRLISGAAREFLLRKYRGGETLTHCCCREMGAVYEGFRRKLAKDTRP